MNYETINGKKWTKKFSARQVYGISPKKGIILNLKSPKKQENDTTSGKQPIKQILSLYQGGGAYIEIARYSQKSGYFLLARNPTNNMEIAFQGVGL